MKKLKDFGELLPAEQKLYDACQAGEVAWIGKERPTEKTEQNEIRAEFIRFLALGGDKEDKNFEIDPRGILLKGAFVSGELDLEACDITFPLSFWDSVFDTNIILLDARFRQLNLLGCKTKGIIGDRLKCEGSVYLRDGFESDGEVSLLGAEIGGGLDCSGGIFTNKKGYALNCDGIKVGGGVHLRGGFESDGEVSLLGAEIGGDLDCSGGKFTNEKGDALSCNRIKVGGSLFLRGSTIEGILNLTSAKCKNLVDEKEFWTQKGLKKIYLDGFAYEHIYSDALDAKSRIEWLDKMPEFKPQPYKQLAKVLREMGHIDDANEIMVEYHDRRSKEFKSPLKIAFFWLYRLFSNYGYKPSKTFKWMVGVWFVCSLIFWFGANKGVFAPSNPMVFQHEKYESSVSAVEFGEMFSLKTEKNGSKNWYFNEKLMGEYTTFQPFWYSLDVILPIVDLYMEKDWGVYIPTPTSPTSAINPFSDLTLNHIVRLVVWLENLMGWVLSLILVAILSGLAKTEKE